MRSLPIVLLSAVVLAFPALAMAGPADRVAHGDVFVGAGERVADAVAFGGDLTVQGWVTGDAVAMGGSVRVLPGARVDGDITALGGGVGVAPGAVTNGDRTALGGSGGGIGAAEVGAGATALPAGPGSFRRGIERSGEALGNVVRKIGHMVGLFVVLLLLGAIMLGVAPHRTRALAAAVAAYPARTLGFGVLVVLSTVAAVAVLFVTVIGIPAAAVVAALAGCAAILGLTGVSILIGEMIPAKGLRDRQIRKLAAGAGILVLALSIPVAGPLVGVLATLLGLGSLAVTRMRPGHVVFSTGSGPYRSAPAP